MLRLPRARREEREIAQLAEEKLAFFGQRLVGYRWDQPAYSPLVREPAPARDRTRDGDEAATPSARRAGGRDESGRDARDDGADRPVAGRGRLHDPRHRARHARRRGDLGPGRRSRPRREDRRGHVRRGRDGPARRRGVPRRVSYGARREQRVAFEPAKPLLQLERRSTPTTARSTSSRTSNLRRGAGRACMPARRERLGEIHDPEDRPRDRQAQARDACSSTARTSPDRPTSERIRRAWRSCPRTGGSLRP